MLAKSGAENFPVALRILPARRRRELMALYGFARTVDDLGDEAGGDRQALLAEARRDLSRVYRGTPIDPCFRSFQDVARLHGIPESVPARLIQANQRDQVRSRYATGSDLLDYCELSAAPIGEMVLYVFDAITPERVRLSGLICAALQILEHLQDVAEDLGRGRVYLPEEDMKRFECDESDLSVTPASPRLRALIRFKTSEALDLLERGAPLVADLKGFARLAVAGYVAGGRATAIALGEAGYDVLSTRVRPSKRRTAVECGRLLLGLPA